MRAITSASNSSIESALHAVIAREAQVKLIPLDHSVSIKLSPYNRRISIATSGREFSGNLDTKLIHQLGNRIWRNRSYDAVLELWCSHQQSDLVDFLEDTLSKSGQMLRYSEVGSTNQIYGITSPNFLVMNQNAFRDALVSALRHHGISPNKNVSHTRFGEVTEEFSVPRQGGQVGLNCRVLYGLNNGYSSYRIIWGRTVLVCSNGLTEFEKIGRDRWLHTRNVTIENFSKASVEAALNHLTTLESQILAANNRPVIYSILQELMRRLVLAKATKERIRARLCHELNDTGPNEWSVSQAFTFLGQHEQAISFRVRLNLTRIGSILLERPLEQLLFTPAVEIDAAFRDMLQQNKLPSSYN